MLAHLAAEQECLGSIKSRFVGSGLDLSDNADVDAYRGGMMIIRSFLPSTQAPAARHNATLGLDALGAAEQIR
jgi:hypothetical protein